MYKEKRIFRSEFVPIRGLSYHVQIWEGPGSQSSNLPALLLVHGWMDVAASYQFMVDALSDAFAQGRRVIAPDWRGFGKTNGSADCYWMPDYLADLDFLLDHYTQEKQIDLIGHSLGGNIAMLYAGIRPERIHKLVNLEGFGLPATQPAQAPERYVKWMDELKSLQRGDLNLKPYNDVAGVARRLMKTNSRLSPDKANWLASHWARENSDGQWQIQGEPGHKIINANLYQAQETLEIYKRISAPLLAVEASDDSLGKWHNGKYTLADYHERLKVIADARVAVVKDAGHMLHHDQPEQLAALIEGFLG